MQARHPADGSEPRGVRCPHPIAVLLRLFTNDVPLLSRACHQLRPELVNDQSRSRPFGLRRHDCLPLVSSTAYERGASRPADMQTCIALNRDINGYSRGSSSVDPINTYRGHTSIVEVGLPSLICLSTWARLFADLFSHARTSLGTTRKSTSLPRAATTDSL